MSGSNQNLLTATLKSMGKKTVMRLGHTNANLGGRMVCEQAALMNLEQLLRSDL